LIVIYSMQRAGGGAAPSSPSARKKRPPKKKKKKKGGSRKTGAAPTPTPTDDDTDGAVSEDDDGEEESAEEDGDAQEGEGGPWRHVGVTVIRRPQEASRIVFHTEGDEMQRSDEEGERQQQEWEVETVVARRRLRTDHTSGQQPSEWQYLVQIVGRPEAESIWLPESALDPEWLSADMAAAAEESGGTQAQLRAATHPVDPADPATAGHAEGTSNSGHPPAE
jgi:hypothetical protein